MGVTFGPSVLTLLRGLSAHLTWLARKEPFSSFFVCFKTMLVFLSFLRIEMWRICLLGIEFLVVSSSHLYPSVLSLTCLISHKCAIKFPLVLACNASFRIWCYNNTFQVVSGLQQFNCDRTLRVCFFFLQIKKFKLLYWKKFTVFSILEKFLSLVLQYYHVR